MTSRRKSSAALERQVDDFNAAYAVGQPVIVRLDSGQLLQTVTRSEAQILSGHSAVIWIEGISGCYLLDCVTPSGSPLSAEGAR